jgi:hypothetical protein
VSPMLSVLFPFFPLISVALLSGSVAWCCGVRGERSGERTHRCSFPRAPVPYSVSFTWSCCHLLSCICASTPSKAHERQTHKIGAREDMGTPPTGGYGYALIPKITFPAHIYIHVYLHINCGSYTAYLSRWYFVYFLLRGTNVMIIYIK